MKFCEYGIKTGKSILCLPGNFMTHRQFEKSFRFLQIHITLSRFPLTDMTKPVKPLTQPGNSRQKN